MAEDAQTRCIFLVIGPRLVTHLLALKNRATMDAAQQQIVEPALRTALGAALRQIFSLLNAWIGWLGIPAMMAAMAIIDKAFNLRGDTAQHSLFNQCPRFIHR